MDRRPGTGAQAAFLGERTPDSLHGAQTLHPVLPGGMAEVGQFVGDEPIAEFRVVGVDVERGVDQMCVIPVMLRHGIFAPLIERLLRKAEDPAGHRDGDTVGGKVEDQRVGL